MSERVKKLSHLWHTAMQAEETGQQVGRLTGSEAIRSSNTAMVQ